MGNPLIEMLETKRKLLERIEGLLSDRERLEALKDHHAHRKPRPCGMTIHTGIGCPLKCTYCYIRDMGFPWTIEPYPLSPLQLVYALLKNPYFIPGERGSFIAIGSVTEPFLEIVKEKTMAYIEAIARYLGNPIQFSTKMYLDIEDAYRLKKVDPGISPLVTIVTLKHYDRLEPHAPPPNRRFETIENLSKAGLKPVLFYRPVIPCINYSEYRDIIDKAIEYEVKAVVVGGFRVTENILHRLMEKGFNIECIIKRLHGRLGGSRQVGVRTSDLKKNIISYAREKGVVALPLACTANLYTHGWRCRVMESYGVYEGVEPPKIDYSVIEETSYYLGVRVREIKVFNERICIYGYGSREKLFLLGELVKYYYRVCVETRFAKKT